MGKRRGYSGFCNGGAYRGIRFCYEIATGKLTLQPSKVHFDDAEDLFRLNPIVYIINISCW